MNEDSSTSALDVQVASTAIVEPGAILSSGVRIWHFAQIRTGASLGRGSVVGTGCFVDRGVVVGHGSKIQNGAQLFAPAILEDGVFVGPGAILTNDRYPRAIAPDGHLLDAAEWNAVGCLVREGAAIGAGAIVICVEVGAWALVGAGSIVTRAVVPHALVLGNPARQVGWVCFCGQSQDGRCDKCGWSADD
jgi:acetyltransferase-like isoleucine patch superfamily enzyme